MQTKNLGAVVQVINPPDLEEILIPNPPYEVQQNISKLVGELFKKKKETSAVENEPIIWLENILARKDY